MCGITDQPFQKPAQPPMPASRISNFYPLKGYQVSQTPQPLQRGDEAVSSCTFLDVTDELYIPLQHPSQEPYLNS